MKFSNWQACPEKWWISRTKGTIYTDLSGKTGIFPDDRVNCGAPEMAMASQFLNANCAIYAKGLPLAAKVHRTICLSLAMHALCR